MENKPAVVVDTIREFKPIIVGVGKHEPFPEEYKEFLKIKKLEGK